jgi:hypothetical protein
VQVNYFLHHYYTQIYYKFSNSYIISPNWSLHTPLIFLTSNYKNSSIQYKFITCFWLRSISFAYSDGYFPNTYIKNGSRLL